MTDGRKHRHARATLGVALTLGLAGAGVVGAAPAHAAPDGLGARIDRAQAETDQLAERASRQVQSRDQARDRLQRARAQLDRLDGRIVEQQRLGSTVRTQLAQEVLDDGTDDDTQDASLSQESEQLLAGVMIVTQDTEGRAEKMTDAMAAVERLVERRAEARATARERRTTTERLERRAATATQARDDAAGTLAGLEAELAERRAAARAEARAEAQAEAEAEAAAEAEAEAAETEASSSSAVEYAMAQVGKSYVWGATGPDSFDCSGLMLAAYATEGITLPRTSGSQYSAGTPVSESELQPGDLVFYYSPISHVGMYVGDGQVVNALNPGTGVQVSGLHDMPYSGAVRPG